MLMLFSPLQNFDLPTNPKYFFLCFSFVDKNEDKSDIVNKVDYGDKLYSDTLFSNKTETNFDPDQVSYSK